MPETGRLIERPPSVLQPPSGQPEEHVLERAPAHQRRRGLQAERPDLRQRVLTIAGIEEYPVGQYLDSGRREVSQLVGGLLLLVEREPELEHLRGRVPGYQVTGRT